MRVALLLFVALAGSALAAEPRVMTERYLAGAGDLACFVNGLGCMKFFVEGGETRVQLVVRDDVRPRVAFDVCSPDCDGATGSFCSSGTLAGLRSGDLVVVFLREVNLGACPLTNLAAAAVRGTITATFT